VRQAADLTEILSRNPDLLRRNPTLATEAGVKASHAVTVAREPVPRRGRMNKLEQAFEREVLEPEQRVFGSIESWQFEGIKLRLADGAYYCPDFFCTTAHGQQCRIYEVKGHRYAAGIVRLKVAADRFKCFAFYLARKVKGEWIIERV
jgi:hypothetical protein